MAFDPSIAQARVLCSQSRFRILNAGRRFGKTHLAAYELQIAARKRGSINWYIAPTYRQAAQIAWAKLKELVPAEYVAAKNESDLSLTLVNRAVIALRGADNPDSLRGPGLDFVVLDEAAFMKREAWTEVLRPSLSDKLGRALFISTPSGYNWFYNLYCKAKALPDWSAYQFTTLQGGNVPAGEIETARAELDEKTFRQEYEASFEALTGRVYYAYDRDENARPCADDGNSTILVGMDFNVNPMSAAFAIRAGDQIHFIGEHLVPNGNTDDMAKAIRRRFPGRQIKVYPDPTGNARKTSAPVGQTDFTILRAAGLNVLAPSHPYPVADKINTVNAAMRNAGGLRRCFVDSGKCPNLSNGFDGLTYREGTSDPDKASGLDHITDAAAYLLMWEMPIRGGAGGFNWGAG